MAITFEKRPYEEEFDMVGAFADKYESLIEDAPRNSLLGMFRDLDDTLGDVLNAKDEDNIDLIRARENIVHVMLIMAQMWSDENQDIELSCVDPATGEEVVVNGIQRDDVENAVLGCFSKFDLEFRSKLEGEKGGV
ncbi:MAG: hypothetical protein J6U54_01210 [Clostridiales bacterium]|nr:hypothetical protein [Clostridiales bacterium]